MTRPTMTGNLATRTIGLIALALLLCTTAFAGEASAAVIGTERKLGAGLGGGSLVSGVTGKYYLGDTSAVQAFAGVGGFGASVGADYVMEFKPLWEPPFGRLFWGAGGGVSALFYSFLGNSSTVIGISGVVELGFHFNAFPVELISDWRPGFYIGDYFGGVHLGYGGGAVRWYF